MAIILFTGGTGMIGTALIKKLHDNGHSTRILVRDKTKADGINKFYWNYYNEEIDLRAFENLDYIINLAGANIGKRWTFKYKKEIYDSRIMSTEFLFQTIKKNNLRIKKIFSANAVGYYGNSESQNLQENSPTGKDFLAMVCRDWENAVREFNTIKIPSCIFRQGVVITHTGGFVKRISLPIKFFIGAHLGSGQQFISWISLADLCRLYLHAIEKNLVGTFNAVSTNPLTLEQIDNEIAKYYHRKIWLPNIPEWALSLVLGELSQSVLESVHTSNEKIKTTGFIFQHEDFGEALKQ
jgi:uncharacterized protein (TIGR01777 family)